MAEGRAGRTVLQLGRRHGQAVDEQRHVDGVLRALAVAQLPDDRQDVGLVVVDQRRIQPRGGLEEAQAEPDAGDQLDAVAQHIERAAGLQGLLQLLEELGVGGGRVLSLQFSPLAGLRLLEELQDQLAVDGERPVIILRFPPDIPMFGY